MKLVRILLALAIVLAISESLARAQRPAPRTPLAEASRLAPETPQFQIQEKQKPFPNQNELPSIKVTSRLVHLVVTVTDRQRNFITDLNQGDFKVLENGTPQEIRFFGRETDLPLRIGLLLDTSNSIRPRLEFEQQAAIDFLNRVIRRTKDLAFLMTFDNEPEVVQDFTGNLSLLMETIRDQRAGGGTALVDAIYRASEKLAHSPLPSGLDPQVRRVIVVISDGNDNLSDHALSDAIEASVRAEAAIYAISTSKYNLDAGDKILQELAAETGGLVFFPDRIDDLPQSFLNIEAELRSQYFISYSPTFSVSLGQYRKIDVQTDRKGLVVRSRKGYYAVASPSPSLPLK